jgi:hypothetical protein
MPPSNRVVTYVDIGLNSVEDYWGKLVVPDVTAFRTEPSAPSVFRAALSVWHLHDWVWHDRNPAVDSSGPAFTAYRAALLAACPELGWLRDITDAGKHRGLSRQPEVKGAEPQRVPFGITSSSRVSRIVGQTVLKCFLVLNDGSIEDLDTVLRTAVAFWRADLSGKKLSDPFQ